MKIRAWVHHVSNEIRLFPYRRKEARCEAKLVRVIRRIATSSLEDLRRVEFVEQLVGEIGLVYDRRDLYGDDIRFMNPIERGLWQIPRQLAEFAVFLSDRHIESFIEVGTYTGHTFSFLVAYLDRFHPGLRAVTIDPYSQCPIKWALKGKYRAEFLTATSADFAGQAFDLCFIDGDHSLRGVREDYEKLGRHARICAFHDINDRFVGEAPENDGGVPAFWRELREQNPDGDYREYLWHSRGASVMGIGAVIRNDAGN